MNVSQAIVALLYDNEMVIVPALGAFVRHDQSAQVNVITNEFQRPGATLEFDPSQREEKPLLIEYMAQQGGGDFEEARQQIAAFVADGFAMMREGRPFVIEGIGTLSLNPFQELKFEPDANADFNPESFGLGDIEVQSVFWDPKNQASITQPSNLNGPDSGDDDPHRSLWWLWLLLILIVIGGGVSLWYFNLWPFHHKPQPPMVVDTVTVDTSKAIPPQEIIEDSIVDSIDPTIDSILIPLGSLDSLAIDSVSQPIDTMAEPKPITDEPIQVVKPLPESKAFVVGGCFGVEQNALNMATEAIRQGCTEAFVMKRGSKFFVCYGQYPSTAAAKAALPEILSQYNPKAWILTK